jgi:hypothetical protein
VRVGIARKPRKQTPEQRVFRAFSSVVTQMPGYNSQRRGTARTSQFTSQFFFFLIVTCVPSSVLCVLFVFKCVLYYRHRVLTQLQLNNNNNNVTSTNALSVLGPSRAKLDLGTAREQAQLTTFIKERQYFRSRSYPYACVYQIDCQLYCYGVKDAITNISKWLSSKYFCARTDRSICITQCLFCFLHVQRSDVLYRSL